ncbi:MAG TPA: hypothetical protein PLY78_05305 [Methanospirillum sp.]|nr:hypothetical protein [Methanospirillum sp.]
MTGRKGPFHLILPKDILMETVDVTLPTGPFIPPSDEYFDRKRVIEATKELCEAQCLVILIGTGAIESGACDDIIERAEMYNIPVATTPKSKGAFPEDHPLALGVLGFGGSPLAEEYIKSDAVIVILIRWKSLPSSHLHRELVTTQSGLCIKASKILTFSGFSRYKQLILAPNGRTHFQNPFMKNPHTFVHGSDYQRNSGRTQRGDRRKDTE